jgi:hypothetical protein
LNYSPKRSPYQTLSELADASSSIDSLPKVGDSHRPPDEIGQTPGSGKRVGQFGQSLRLGEAALPAEHDKLSKALLNRKRCFGPILMGAR